MKRLISILFGLLLGAWTQGVSGPSPIVNMGGGPNLIERSLFASSTPTLPYSSWYVPGNGSPAISTSDYYLMNGIWWSRPWDLDTMGAEGAAIKAREGFRYVWMMCGDHALSVTFQGSSDFYVGYSNDPQIWPDPTTIRMLRRQEQSITVVDQNGYTQKTFVAYQAPWLVYNPDSAGDKFYIYAEGYSVSSARQHELTLFTTSDFLATTLVGPAIPTTAFSGWTSLGFIERLGVNSWSAYTFGKADGSAKNMVYYKYTSTDGWVWRPDYSHVIAGPGPYLTISGQTYLLDREVGTVNDYLSLLAVDANKVSLGTYTRVSTAFGPSSGNNQVYPGPTWLQGTPSVYEEDGVASIGVTRGYAMANSNYQLNAGPFLNNFPGYMSVTGTIASTGGLNGVLTVTSNTTGLPIEIGFNILGQPGPPAVTSDNGDGTYNIAVAGGLVSPVVRPTRFWLPRNGGLWHDFIDQYFLITDATAAASAAPLGVRASCAAGIATVQWNNSLPHQNYRVYKGSTAGTQATLVGDVTGTSVTDTPTANQQTWYKVVTMNVTEQKSRVVNTYCSANTEMVNRHVNRVINDGGDIAKINFVFLASADAWLTSNDTYRYLNYWTDVRFGIKESGGFITKIYDLGTTLLPRGGDYTPTTSKTFPSTTSGTTYSETSFRGTAPSWVNSASSPGFFGNGRANIIQRKNEITLLAAYQKPGTAIASLFGDGQFGGMYLQHASGSAGNVTFGMAQDVDGGLPFITATVPFSSATAAHVAAGVFDGSIMTAYLDGVAGTPVSATAYSNPTMTNTNVLRGMYRPTSSTAPVLCSGTSTCIQTLLTRAYGMANEADFTGAGLAAFEKGLPAATVQSWGALYN